MRNAMVVTKKIEKTRKPAISSQKSVSNVLWSTDFDKNKKKLKLYKTVFRSRRSRVAELVISEFCICVILCINWVIHWSISLDGAIEKPLKICRFDKLVQSSGASCSNNIRNWLFIDIVDSTVIAATSANRRCTSSSTIVTQTKSEKRDNRSTGGNPSNFIHWLCKKSVRAVTHQFEIISKHAALHSTTVCCVTYWTLFWFGLSGSPGYQITGNRMSQ